MDRTKEMLADPQVSETALKVFHRIAHAWNLEVQEAQDLLGSNVVNDSVVSEEVLERISFIFGIYRNLRTIFPSEEQANSWIKKPNQEFGGESALAVMLSNPVKVKRYLDAQM